MFKVLLFALYLIRAVSADGDKCDLGCSAFRLLGDGIQLSDGIRLVRSGRNETSRDAPDSVVSAMRRFIESYDINFKLQQFLPPVEEITSGLRTALAYLSGSEARGDAAGKKGNGLLMMATMLGGTMATLGFGALGTVAMKALTLSAMALTISIVTGLKKLLSKHDHESGHIISYVPVPHGARRRRDTLG